MNIADYLGITLDYAVIAIAALMVLVLILIIVMIVNVVQMKKLKKNYRIFMDGKDAKTLEDTLIKSGERREREEYRETFRKHEICFPESWTCKV